MRFGPGALGSVPLEKYVSCRCRTTKYDANIEQGQLKVDGMKCCD